MTEQNTSLKAYNTFQIEANADFFCSIRTAEDINLLRKKGIFSEQTPFFILGGGSNVLFMGDFKGVIIHPVNDELIVEREDENHVWLTAGAGLEWDTLVAYTVEKGWGGLENLSLIPGTVGASPVQNIGAYGVEAGDVIEQVRAIELFDGSEILLSKADCEFGYRNSIFKRRFRNRYLVYRVTYKLSKKPEFKLHYGNVKDEVEKLGEINLKNVRKVISDIRRSKLPDHTIMGNAGSFFKNPVIDAYRAQQLRAIFPDMVSYPAESDMVKLAAGWLIEQAGMKGWKLPNGRAGVHQNQALVIVNHGGAGAGDVEEVAREVQRVVFEKFSVCLEPEVLFI